MRVKWWSIIIMIIIMKHLNVYQDNYHAIERNCMIQKDFASSLRLLVFLFFF